MIQRSTAVISPEKAKDFAAFIERNAKDKAFWDDVKKVASAEIDKRELDLLFNEKDK